jgi:DMSO/TMAO reductase YedYZ molybdopterin-dependent catalytic subunit
MSDNEADPLVSGSLKQKLIATKQKWAREGRLLTGKTGVSATHLLDVVKPKADAKHVVFHSYDGYTTNVSLEMFSASDLLLAHSWEGKPLTREHGGPVRVIMPQYYFWKSAKWIERIEFVAIDKPGFWEVRGYHNEGDPWKKDRYS